MASRFNLEDRMKKIGIPSKTVIKKLGEKGIDCSASVFSKAINGQSHSDNAEYIAYEAHKVVSDFETKLASV